jgi:demethylmenaquinone methyltransferase/2-methoxy-6-polyprenyl-1,4-benzoquinol methylase
MIAEARKNFSGPISRGIAEQLPIRTGTFDFVTMGIALRHVADLRAAIGEYFRVLKPGGTLWILDSHVPKSPIGHAVSRFIWAKLVPGITLLATRDRDAKLLMDFYWDTIDKSVPPETIVSVMRDVGFEQARAKVVLPGSFCEYVGRKPAAAGN